MVQQTQIDHAAQMPITGMGRAKDILPYLPFGKTTLWKLIKEGKFPSPIRFSSRMSCWKYEAVREWLVIHWQNHIDSTQGSNSL